MEIRDDAEFGHDEADITMVSCVTEAANSGKSVIRIYSDDTDVFVPLVCCVCRKELQCQVQMDWSGGLGQCWIPTPPALT